MKRIFTHFLAIACLLAASFSSFSQCTLSTTAPTGAPGASNTFSSGTEGFSGNIQWNGNPKFNIETNAGTGSQLITPIYYLLPGTSTIIVRMNIDKVASASITGYSVTAVTGSNPSIPLCNVTGLSITPNNSVYYLSIPRGSLVPGANFKLLISFSGGNFTFDNFGTNAAVAAGALPVKFSSFEAKKGETGVALTWKVGTEENVLGYEIEKSTNGSSFEKIGFVSANGQSVYNFTDVKSVNGASFYRIKSVDNNAKFAYSTVLSLKAGKMSVVFKAFPTVFQKQVTVQHDAATADTHILVSSEDGRTIKNIVPAVGSQQTVIDLSSAKAGMYLVRFDNGNGAIGTLKIVKQ